MPVLPVVVAVAVVVGNTLHRHHRLRHHCCRRRLIVAVDSIPAVAAREDSLDNLGLQCDYPQSRNSQIHTHRGGGRHRHRRLYHQCRRRRRHRHPDVARDRGMCLADHTSLVVDMGWAAAGGGEAMAGADCPRRHRAPPGPQGLVGMGRGIAPEHDT